MTSETAIARACSLAAQAAGEQPEGWAIEGRRFLLVEVPLPWPADIEMAPGFPPNLANVLAGRDQHDPYVEGIAPDHEFSVPGLTRIVLLDRPAGPARRFRRTEHVVPPAEVAGVVGSWLAEDPTAPGDASPAIRDLLVCTHGAHDQCCGRFGAPLYQALRQRARIHDARVWRCSHTGGHRFAPTLIDLPSGRSWARLGPAQVDALLDHAAPPASLRGHYRGWAILPSFYERLAETELLFSEGWGWLDREISGTLVEGHPFIYPEEPDELDDRAVVRLEAAAGAGRPAEAWLALIERGADTVTRGECGEEPWDAPSYRVTEIRAVVPGAVGP